MLKIIPPDKDRFVSAMFGRISPRYDIGNRMLSWGRDRAWRRRAVKLLNAQRGDTVLDVGAGTADLSLELAEAAGSIVALDFSLPMLHLGLGKARATGKASRIPFVAGDILRLPFGPSIFDVVAAAFTVRNLAQVNDGFSEMLRVLKPGGRLLCLEFMKPPSSVVNFFYRPYLRHILPIFGALVTGDRAAYTYLAASISTFSTPLELARTMEATGFSDVEFHLFNLGTVGVHMGRKPVEGNV